MPAKFSREGGGQNHSQPSVYLSFGFSAVYLVTNIKWRTKGRNHKPYCWLYDPLTLKMYYFARQLCPVIPSRISTTITGPRSAVGNVSGNRCESKCRFRGREFDPGPVPYFRGDWSWNNFYGHSPPFRWIIQEKLLSVTSESMCTKYWLTACSSLPRKKCG